MKIFENKPNFAKIFYDSIQPLKALKLRAGQNIGA